MTNIRKEVLGKSAGVLVIAQTSHLSPILCISFFSEEKPGKVIYLTSAPSDSGKFGLYFVSPTPSQRYFIPGKFEKPSLGFQKNVKIFDLGAQDNSGDL